MDIDHLNGLSGPNAFSISKMALDRCHLSAKDMRKVENGDFGLSGTFTFDQQLKITHGEVPKQITFDGIDHLMKGKVQISADTSVRIFLERLGLTGQNVSVQAEDYGSLQSGLKVRSGSFEMAVHRLEPLDVDIHDLSVEANLDKAVTASLSAEVLHLPDPSVVLDLGLVADIKSVADKLPSQVLSGISGTGDLTVALSLSGRKPNQREIKAIETLVFMDNLAFVDRLNLDVRLNKGSLALPTAGGEQLEVQAIDAKPLLSYTLNGHTGKGALYSSVSAKGIKAWPDGGGENIASALFSIAAEHEYLEKIDLRPSVTLLPTDATASANVSIEGVGKLVGKTGQTAISSLLTTVGIDASAVVDVPELGSINELGFRGIPSVGIHGPLATDVRFRLQPDRSIVGSLSLATNELKFRMPELITVDRLDTDFTFSKSFAIVRSGRNLLAEVEPQLSAAVMAMDGPVQPSSARSPIQRHIRRLNERMNPAPTISFVQADIESAPFPLTLEDSIFMVNFDKGVPNLDFFQVHLLGGTLNGSLSMVAVPKDKERGFGLDTAIYFSGIDMAEIFPETFTKPGQAETDLSGLLHANIPVSSSMRTLLENADVNVEFTKIGALALERLLYAIDPYENNEAIVSQRQLLKTGTPKHFKMDMKDGFLTLDGNVSVKGVNITLPTLRRLNIARIPGLSRFEEELSRLAPIIDGLQKLSATTMIVDEKANLVSFE